VRRLLRRFPPQPDGWGEWPGTFSVVQALAVERELDAMDASA
jgi:hypothetical protein